MSEFYNRIHDLSAEGQFYSFEPTITSFKNAIVVNYKKTGTRFFRGIAGPELDNRQLDLFLHHNNFDSSYENINKIEYFYNTFYIKTIFDKKVEEEGDHFLPLLKSYSKFKNQREFLQFEGVSSWQQLLFDNPHKEIIYIIRNPITRFLSGVVQIVSSFPTAILQDEKEYKKLEKCGDFTNEEIKLFCKNYEITEKTLKNTEVKKIVDIYVRFLIHVLKYRWDWIIGDMHTDSYLNGYLSMINSTKNDNIKIMDLKDCSTYRAMEFFSKIKGDDYPKNQWEDKGEALLESNKLIYRYILDNDEYSHKVDETPIWRYLNSDILAYQQLKNSKYFYNPNEDISNR